MAKRIGVVGLVLALTLAFSAAAFAAEIEVKAGDSVGSIVAAQSGKSVTLRLAGGEELTGKVRTVTETLVHLNSLVGREFFDAVVPIKDVQAVIIRTKP
jgi:hypothetical protein